MKRITLLLAGMLVFGLIAGCEMAPVQPAEVTVNGYRVERDEGGRPTGKVDLSVSALDSRGQLISTARIRSVAAEVTDVGRSGTEPLQTTAYTVTGGVCGDIAASEGPLATVLMLDETGSMWDYDRHGLRFDAAKQFVDRMGDQDVAAIARFSTSVRTTQGLLNAEVMQDFTSDKTLLRQAIDRTYLASGGTPLWDATHDAVTLLRQRSEANRVGIIMTDGQNNSGRHSARSANQYAKDNNIVLYAIGFGGAAARELDQLTDGTGGFRDLAEVERIENMFNNIFNATQAQGCIDLIFEPVPTSGTRLQGMVALEFDRSRTSSEFDIRF